MSRLRSRADAAPPALAERPRPRRDPAHVIYDHACELAAAAAALRGATATAADPDDVHVALPCVSATLDAVADALEGLAGQIGYHVEAAQRRSPQRARELPDDGAAPAFRDVVHRLRRSAAMTDPQRAGSRTRP